MKKIFKSRVFLIIICAIVFTSIGVIAANTIEATNIAYKNTTVEEAIDDLYTKAKPDYTGTTTFTPSNETQTVLTQNKILRNDITINPIPSSFKELTTPTTVEDIYLLAGKTAYDNNGNLVLGTRVENCITGTFVCGSDCTGSAGQEILNYKSKTFIATSSDTRNGITYHGTMSYNLDESQTKAIYYDHSKDLIVELNIADYYNLNNKLIVKNFGNDWLNKKWYYMACK